jgi:Domain of unknown function (DUF5060)/Protein of unknown function (DUF4038)/Putative collagen-binding domain of a collagenase
MTRPSGRVLGFFALLVAMGALLSRVLGVQPVVVFSQSSARVEAYDMVEVNLRVKFPAANNPFTDRAVRGEFRQEGGVPVTVDGFCDSADGTVYRIRFMPTTPGKYEYSVVYRDGDLSQSHTGRFAAVDGKRRGILRVDKDYPWHFIWEGTGEHYFFNGTTAFLLMGWRDERVIRDSIDRLHRLQVNRIRVLLGGGRSASFWGEPIIPSDQFQSYLNPWVAAHPSDLSHPDFDYTRFNIPHWQRFERMLRHAREEDMVISVVFDWNDSPVHPEADSEDERRYFRYAIARLSAFSNVTWDLGDDISSYRSLDWSHWTGTLVSQWDPYRHLATDHPADNKHQDRTAEWFGFTSFQEWPRPLHRWMLDQRRAQARTGRIIPQTNEEYGYEDHYPKWSPSYPGGASADANRRAAWEMAMAGTYQTTGETAKRGTGVWPDTGGGWVNGRGDSTMVMLEGYAHMVEFFTSFEWWKANPLDELVGQGAFCLAEPGRVYAVYLPNGGDVKVKLTPGRYQAGWFNPRTGTTIPLPPADGPVWTSPRAPDSGDWALLLRKATRPGS